MFHGIRGEERPASPPEIHYEFLHKSAAFLGPHASRGGPRMRSEKEHVCGMTLTRRARKADAEYSQARARAARKRDAVLNVPWEGKSPHVDRAAEARYARLEEAARVARDEKLMAAEAVLMKGLDDCEEEQQLTVNVSVVLHGPERIA